MSPSLHIFLTPSQRLARQLQQQEAEAHVQQGRLAWEPAPILAMDTWLRSLHSQQDKLSGSSITLTSVHQAHQLWQAVIGEAWGYNRCNLAQLAATSWLHIHQYQLPQPEQWPSDRLNDDQRAFQSWARAYRKECLRQNVMDFAVFISRLPGWIESGELTLPDKITLHGFALPLPPSHQTILRSLEKCGVAIERRKMPSPELNQAITIHRCPSAEDEVIRAAQWAKAQLEDYPNRRLAIVIPDLGSRLRSVESLLTRVLDPPAFCLEPYPKPVWHISLGHPLNDWPIVSDALALLQCDGYKITQPSLSRWLKSPWLAGWPEEHRQRDRLLLKLHDQAPHWVGLDQVIQSAQVSQCKIFGQRLTRWMKKRQACRESLTPGHWARQFQEELSALGFGFGRPLDSVEHQVLSRWHQSLEALSELAVVMAPAERISRAQALSQLQDILSQTIFREQDPGTSIALLGVQEAMGTRFDAMWLTGMDNEQWPSPPRTDPLIPLSMQNSIPKTTPEGCLNLAEQEIESLLTGAPQIVASFAYGDDLVDREPTRLLLKWTSLTLMEHQQALPLWSAEAITLETLGDDISAPLAPAGETQGGVRLLNDQSACPFRAFVIHRLKGRDHRMPRPGMSAKDRGTLIHKILEAFWLVTQDSEGLTALDEDALADQVQTLVCEHLDRFLTDNPFALTAAGRQLEIENLSRKILSWLAVERTRPPFRTSASQLETKRPLPIGPLTLFGQPDRIDELDSGGPLVIDYKTGEAKRSLWNPNPRLADGQLPIYALTLDPPPKAIAFAKISNRAIQFEGFSEHDLSIPGIEPIDRYNRGGFKPIANWSELIEQWRTQLTELATAFQQGNARVAPAHPTVCRHCHLKPVCRIQERRAWNDDEADLGGNAND